MQELESVPVIEKDPSIAKIKEILDIQKEPGNHNFSPYMLGMANGLILALSILENKDPEYLKEPVEGFIKDMAPRCLGDKCPSKEGIED